jgi:2-keto-4-pentenoate hydratase/2-oxohepta-3-ene-1,7-dioic acid hydratase in catechol pathway
MALPVVRFEQSGHTGWGVLFNDLIAPLGRPTTTTGELVEHAIPALRALTARQATVPLSSVRLLSPITAHQQFVCQGINYASHVRESGMDPAKIRFNTIFTKASSCLTGPHDDVVRPAHVQLLDYEIELGLVMKRSVTKARAITPDNLHELLAGVTIVNDVSARDVQLPQMQFYKGKSYRSFGPAGPVLLLLDAAEWKRWPELRMRLTVNGQVRQETLCGDMLFAPHQTLTELSALQDLHAGDLIATGTPAGCAAKAPGKLVYFVMNHLLSPATKWKLFIQKSLANPLYLKPGDRMTASIRTDDGALDLGEQRNRIVAA